MFSEAHLQSRKFVIDPAYSAEPVSRRRWDSKKYYWLYGHCECEAFLLENMIREKNSAKLKVGYTEFRHLPSPQIIFRREFSAGVDFEFRACGSVTVKLNGNIIAEFADEDRILRRVNSANGGEITVMLQCADICTGLPALMPERFWNDWFCSLDGGSSWQEAEKLPALNDGNAPHRRKLNTLMVTAEKLDNGVWDCGCELFGFVRITSATSCRLRAGESMAEVCNENPLDFEQNTGLVKIGNDLFRSEVPLACRYLRVLDTAGEEKVEVEALFHPVQYCGAFAVPGDDELTRIWMHSAYTLRLCMHNFLLDGIKRDRLPWAGDLAVSLLGNAFVFGDGEIVKASLRVLNADRIRRAHINTIVDYTAWFLICHDLYQLYFEDMEFLQSEYPAICETVEELFALTAGDGTIIIREQDWSFIDWVPGEKFTAIQLLYVRAMRAVSALARRMNDDSMNEKAQLYAAKLANTIRETMFDRERKLFTAAPGNRELSRHANLLAAATGFAADGEMSAIGEALCQSEMPPVGTPYMAILEALALQKCGKSDAAIALIRQIWGGMLKLGATTFWEGFDPAEQEPDGHYRFYDRPFGKSLCHAWSCGPLFFLPQLLTGLQPLSDGWKSFRLAPVPGCNVELVVPTPNGNIEISICNGRLFKCTTPPGCRRED